MFFWRKRALAQEKLIHDLRDELLTANMEKSRLQGRYDAMKPDYDYQREMIGALFAQLASLNGFTLDGKAESAKARGPQQVDVTQTVTDHGDPLKDVTSIHDWVKLAQQLEDNAFRKEQKDKMDRMLAARKEEMNRGQASAAEETVA
jgi:hypothetical protein